MVNPSDRWSNRDSSTTTVSIEAAMQHLQRQVATLEQENRALWADLQACQRSQSAQAQVAELERAYAVLQAEVRERHRCEAVLQGQAQALTRTLEALIATPDLDQFLGQVLETIVQQMGEEAGGLWLYDASIECLRLHLSYENSQVHVALQSSHPGKSADATHQDRGQLQQLREHKAIVLDRHYLMTDPKASAYRAFVEERGIQSILNVPLFLKEEFLGTFTVRSTTRETYSAEEIDLAQALAQQAVLAIQTTRLADEAKQAAIAREQEQAAQERAAELAKANEALQESLSKLADEPELEKFLGHVLTVCAERLGAIGAGIWHFEGDIGYLIVSYEDGNVHLPPESCHPGTIRAIAQQSHEQNSKDDVVQLSKGEMLATYEEDFQSNPEYQPYLDYLQQRGIKAILSSPMFLGDSLRGSLTLRFDHRRVLKTEEVELAHALANQATLALELTRLADEAKQAAIACEQEKAAQERAAKLAQANEVLRASAESLTSTEDLDSFLGHVLLAITKQLGARSSAVWINDQTAKLSYLRFVIENGVAVHAEQSSHPNARIPAQLAPNPPMLAYFTAKAQPCLTQVLNDPALTDQQRQYLETLGVKALLGVPMILHNEHIGSFTVRIEDDRSLLEEDLELIQALANQATLAVQLTRLAEEAKQAAIAREQEKAAQERAAQLAKANTVLRRSLDALLTQPNVDIFVGQILLAILEEVEATSGTIWLHDLTRNVGRLHLVCENGRVMPAAQSNHPDRGREQPLRERSHYSEYEQGRCYIYRVEPKFPFDEDHISYLRNAGAQALLCVPMMLGEEPIGSFTVRLPEMIELTQERRELIESLANQATLALKLTQLAEEAKQAAIAREQEKAAQERAAELAKANAALRQSIDALTTQPSIEAFLSVTLSSIAEVLEVPSACHWQYKGEWSHLQLVYQDGSVIPAEQSDHPNAKQPAAFDPGVSWDSNGKPYTYPYFFYIDDLTWGIRDTYAEMMQRLGVRCLLIAPIVIGDRAVGSVTARLTHAMPDPSPARLELVSALATQAALALQMADLAEQAKQEAEQAATLNERNRIAREIHDTLAQCLTGVIVQLQAATYTDLPDTLAAHLTEAIDLAKTGLIEARRSVKALRPQALETASSLDAALTQLAHYFHTHTLRSTCQITGIPYALPAEVEANLLRIAQEALTNCIRHAHAREVAIDLIYQPQQVSLQIHDNGCGFNPTLPTLSSYGLVGMRERAATIGATLTLNSQIDAGTVVAIVLPIAPEG